MKITGTEIYEEQYINEIRNNTIPERIDNRIEEVNREEKAQLKFTGHDKLVSQNERDFFIKLFPDNSEQLQKHVLFNQNGKLQTPALNKGTIVDGRI